MADCDLTLTLLATAAGLGLSGCVVLGLRLRRALADLGDESRRAVRLSRDALAAWRTAGYWMRRHREAEGEASYAAAQAWRRCYQDEQTANRLLRGRLEALRRAAAAGEDADGCEGR